MTLPTNSVFTLSGVGIYYPTHRRNFRSDPFWVLRDVNLQINESEIVGIVGDNGTGKSTLLKILAGILKPDKGALEKRRDLMITLLSLQAGFRPNLSGRDNALVNGVLLGMTRKHLLERMDQIRELSDIGDFFDEPLKTYSSGMKSRLGFAIAYFTNPDVMLLDEILSVGDHDFSVKSRTLIQEKINEGRTTLIISHSEHLLKELCTRLIWIGEGTVLDDGDPDRVWLAYRSHYRKRIGKVD